MNTKELIETAFNRFLDEIPALKQLKIIVRLDLRARGDTQTWSVHLPDATASKDIPDHSLIEIEVQRPLFNELAIKGTIKEWHEAFDHGDVKASGQEQFLKLVATVISKHEARTKLKKVKK